MEQKKEYTEPKMEIITLESQQLLDVGSSSGQLGIAPPSSDPKDLA